MQGDAAISHRTPPLADETAFVQHQDHGAEAVDHAHFYPTVACDPLMRGGIGCIRVRVRRQPAENCSHDVVIANDEQKYVLSWWAPLGRANK